MVFSSKVELVNDMAHVELGSMTFHLDLHVVVKVGVTGNVKVAWNFLYCKGPHQSATVVVSECLSNSLQLTDGIWLPKKFVTATVEVGTVGGESPFLDRSNIGMM